MCFSIQMEAKLGRLSYQFRRVRRESADSSPSPHRIPFGWDRRANAKKRHHYKKSYSARHGKIDIFWKANRNYILIDHPFIIWFVQYEALSRNRTEYLELLTLQNFETLRATVWLSASFFKRQPSFNSRSARSSGAIHPLTKIDKPRSRSLVTT